jgi:hypothetical protein
MELDERIKLLGDLLAINENTQLPEDEVWGLVNFLCELSNEQREKVLDYINKGAIFNRFEYFAKLANKPAEEREKYLKALNLIGPQENRLFADIFSSTAEGGRRVNEVVDQLVSIRERFEGGVITPLRRLFGNYKSTEKKSN